MNASEKPKSAILSVACVAVSVATTVIIVAVVVILAVTLTFSLKAADDFAASYSKNSISAAQNKVNDFVKIPIDAYASVRMATEFGLLPKIVGSPNDETRRLMYHEYMRYFQPMLYAAEFQVVYVACGLSDGSWISCYVRNQSNFDHYCTYINLLNGTRNSYTANYNATGLTSSSISYNNFDPRTRAWYVGGPKDQGAIPLFSTVFISSSFGVPVVGVNGPLYAKDGTFMGVTSIPLDLRQIAVFLSRLPRTENGLTALVDEEGFMLGASDKGQLSLSSKYNATTDGPMPAGCGLFGTAVKVCRLTPTQYSNPVLRELATVPGGIFANDHSTFTIEIKLQGKPWMVSKAPIVAATSVLHANISWQIYTLMPVSDVTGPIITGRNAGIAVACVMVVVSCVACGVALYRLLHPLSTLSELMEQAAELKDDSLGATMDKSSMREIRTIQDSFERLSAQLKKAKSFLPASLLAQLEASEDEHKEEPEELSRVGATSVSYAASAHDAKTTMSSNHRKNRNCNDTASHATGMSNSVMASKKVISSSISLSQRSVTVAVLNFRDFHRNTFEQSSGLEASYGRLVDDFQRIAKDHRGIMDSFHGDHFTFTFNTIKPCGTHASMATMAMLQIVASMEQTTHKSIMKGSTVTCGVATGKCLIGNLGSEKAKRFTVIGAAYSQATVLERLCKRYPNTPILVSADTVKECELHIGILYMDIIESCGGKAMPIAAAKYLKESARKKLGDEEWMYEMNNQSVNCSYQSGNRAFLSALNGDANSAKSHLASFTEASEESEWVRGRIVQYLTEKQPTSLGLYYDRCILSAGSKSVWESKADD